METGEKCNYFFIIYPHILSANLHSSVFLVQTFTRNKKMCQQVLALKETNASVSK